MLPRLPEFVDPWRLAASGTRFAGEVPLSALSRLADALSEDCGGAVFELEFYLDERRRPCVRSRVKSNLTLECQRCLGAMSLPIETRLQAMFVRSLDEAELVPEEFEPVLLEEEERLRLYDLIEDDLILALPQAPMHQSESCQPNWGEPRLEAGSQEAPPERENPFSVLSAFKKETTTKT